MDIITFHLQRAFEQTGCSICRLQRDAAARYIQNFLWEFVNDGEKREQLRRSLGYCSTHAWQLANTERDKFGGGLGTGIVYEDLTRQAITGLRELRAQENSWQRDWLDHARDFLREKFRLSLPPRSRVSLPLTLVPHAECNVCEIGARAERTHVEWLVKECAEPEFRDAFTASDGLCLPHLRAALEMTEDKATRAFLIATTLEKTEILAHQLSEYLRKHNWTYHDEPKLPAEQSAWLRAVEFFVGKP